MLCPNRVRRASLRYGAACCLLAGITALAPAHANLIVNGEFSSGPPPPSSGCAPGITNSDLPDWSITNNVDIDSALKPFPACSGISPPVGTYFLDLTGSFAPAPDRGTITQDVSTHAGAAYDLSFYFGGNPQWQAYMGVYPNDGSVKSMDVLLNGLVVGTYSVNTAGVPITDGQFKLENIDFTASGSTTMLSFESLDGVDVTAASDFGPLLADVDMKQVPEPESLWVLLGGLCCLGVIAFARKAVLQRTA